MKSIITAFVIASAVGSVHAQTNVWQPSPGHVQIPLWPGAAPDAQPVAGPEFVHPGDSPVAGQPVLIVERVAQPTMTVYPPSGTNTGAAVVVFPGGGYQILAIDLEGSEVCDWFASHGITAILLKYRVPIHRVGAYGESKPALEDAQRALSLVRFHAAEWHINPRKIGVIGFSAGGHLVAATSTRFNHRAYPAVDAADEVSCRPDFAIACYPGHLWEVDAGFVLNSHVTVTSNTPPTFMVQAENDPVDNINHSLVYYIALKNAGVPVELHLYADGKHAFGMRRTQQPITEWPQLAERWLATIGMTSR